MERTNPTGTEPQPIPGNEHAQDEPAPAGLPVLPESIPALDESGQDSARKGEIQVGKTVAIMSTGASSSHIEIFTLTLDGETTQLIPGTKWNQMDQHKWTARGKLPAAPIGLDVTLEFEPSVWETSGLYLMASVVDRFLALHATVNSFVRTRAVLRGRPGRGRVWPARAGMRVLL